MCVCVCVAVTFLTWVVHAGWAVHKLLLLKVFKDFSAWLVHDETDLMNYVWQPSIKYKEILFRKRMFEMSEEIIQIKYLPLLREMKFFGCQTKYGKSDE